MLIDQSLIFAVLALTPALVNSKALDVTFKRFAGNSCDPKLQIEKDDILHNNHCRNWGKKRRFESFSFHKAHPDPNHNNYAWMYDLPDCNVAVYSEKDCQGERYIMGPFPAARDKCGHDFGFWGQSVGVACDSTHPYGGVGCPRWCAGAKQFDFMTQVEAGGIKHNETELPCCRQKKPSSWTPIGVTWQGATCKKSKPEKMEPTNALNKDRIAAAKYNKAQREKARKKLEQSAVESKRKKEEMLKKEKEQKEKYEELEEPDEKGCIGGC